MLFYKKSYSSKFHKIHRKTPVLESLFNKVALLKRILWQRSFPLNFVKFLRTAFLQNTSGRLLLKGGTFISYPVVQCYLYYTALLISIFSLNTAKCVKNADHNNSEYGHCLHTAWCILLLARHHLFHLIACVSFLSIFIFFS